MILLKSNTSVTEPLHDFWLKKALEPEFQKQKVLMASIRIGVLG